MRRHGSVIVFVLGMTLAGVPSRAAAQVETRSRDAWIALARGGFTLPAGQRAVDLLVEMSALLASPDPVLRDEVAYSAAEKWILRDKAVGDPDVVRLTELWRANLADGLGTSGDARALSRSFSALSLSTATARHAASPVFTDAAALRLFEDLLDYLRRERDLRGFDVQLGWIHATAHTADALKFLARAATWRRANLPPLLEAVQTKIEMWEGVFAWGEAERLAAMLHAAVRRSDADLAALTPWLDRWTREHEALWAKGPHVDPARYARVENAKQVLRALHALLSMEQSPSGPASDTRQAVLAALARLR